MTLDELTRIALEEYDGMGHVMDDPMFAEIRNDMRDAVLAVLQAVKKECVPPVACTLSGTSTNDWERHHGRVEGFNAAREAVLRNLDALIQEKV